MIPSNHKLKIITATAVIATLSVIAFVVPIHAASSEHQIMMDHTMPSDGQMPAMMQQRHRQMMQMHSQEAMQTPTMPGQDAFSAMDFACTPSKSLWCRRRIKCCPRFAAGTLDPGVYVPSSICPASIDHNHNSRTNPTGQLRHRT
jgi:hypothetical protein